MLPRCVVPLSAAVCLLGLAACTGTAPTPKAAPKSSATADALNQPDARSQLASRATIALDKSFAGLYTYTTDSGTRNIVATVAADGTWKVDIPGGAQAGAVNISIVSVAAGVYQCTLTSSANPITQTCVRVANPGKPVPATYDPQVQRLFRQWLTSFTDPNAALSVAAVKPLAGAQGDCWSVDSMSSAISAPVDVGIYCYSADGVLTAARVGFGQLMLTNQVAGPATVPLPGAVVPGPAYGTAAPSPGPSDQGQ